MFPSASVTYTGSNAFCDGISANTTVRHAVGLNIFCSTLADGDYLFTRESFFECGDVSDRFDLLYSEYGLDQYLHFVCSQHVFFPSGSFVTNSQTISNVTVSTDAFWKPTANIDGCYKRDTLRSPSLFPSESPTEMKLPTQSPFKEIAVPTTKSTSIPISAPVTGPGGTQAIPPTASKESSSNAGAIAGGSIAAVAVLAILAFLFIWKKNPLDSHQKPPGSGADFSASETNTDANTAPPLHTSKQYGTPSSSLATDVAMAQAPVQQSPNRVSYSGPPMPSAGTYDVRFKDQARSVLGTSQASVPMVVPGVPITEAIPIAVPMDTSGASGNSRNSIKSEPPGRRSEDP
jgi:hypothetical protein